MIKSIYFIEKKLFNSLGILHFLLCVCKLFSAANCLALAPERLQNSALVHLSILSFKKSTILLIILV